MQKKHSLVKSGIALSLATLLSRILGLLREMTKAAFLGTDALADAFGIAFQLPNLLRRLFAENSVSVAFIPTFRSRIEKENAENKNETQDFISSTFTLITFLTSLVSILGILASPLIIKLLYGNSDTESIPEAVFLTRFMFPYLALVSAAALFQGILNGENIFVPSGFSPVLFNAIVVAFTFIFSPYTKNPARAMAIGVIAGGAVQASFQLPFILKKTPYKIMFTPIKHAFKNPGTREVIFLVLPTIVGMAAYQVNDIVSSLLAKRCGTGVYASLQYSLRLQELMLGIFAVSIGSVILPSLASFASQKKWENFETLFVRAAKIMLVISVPITFYSLVYGKEIISLVYKTKRFDENSTMMTLSVFRFHMIGLSAIAINRIASPAFYAQKNTKLPTLAGLCNFAVNIALASMLSKPMKGAGIALALSAASFANTAFLFFALPRLHTIDARKIASALFFYTVKMTAFSIAAVLPVFFLRNTLIALFAGHTRLISDGAVLVCSSLIFGAIGIFLLTVTHDEIANEVLKKLFTKKNNAHGFASNDTKKN